MIFPYSSPLSFLPLHLRRLRFIRPQSPPSSLLSRHFFSSLSSRSIAAACTTHGSAPNPGQFPHSSLLSRRFFSTQKQKSEDDGADAPVSFLKGLALVKKEWGISNSQILTCLAVHSAVASYSPFHSLLGSLCFFVSLYHFHFSWSKYPSSRSSVGARTLRQSLVFGTAFEMINGQVMSGAFAVSTAVVASLTGYTFWSTSKGKKFNFFRTFLCSSLAPVPGLLMAFGPYDPVLYGGHALALVGGSFWLFWHLRKGIREIMTDYVHNKLVQTSITEAESLRLLLNATNISMLLFKLRLLFHAFEISMYMYYG